MRVSGTNDRSAFVNGPPTDAADVATAERPLSAANWYYRPKADLRCFEYAALERPSNRRASTP